MRRLAPMIILSSFAAFATPHVLAGGDKHADTTAQNMGEPKTEAAKPYDEDNKQVDNKDKSDKPMKKKTAKAKVHKDAKVADASAGTTASGNAGMTASADTTASASANNPPLNVTRAEEAKSTTGKSGGQ